MLVDQKLNAKDFCQGFFHIDDSKEFEQDITCIMCQPSSLLPTTQTSNDHLTADICKRMVVWGVAQLQTANRTTCFLRVYHNKFYGNSNTNEHVEELVRVDPQLGRMLRTLATKPLAKEFSIRGCLTLYVTYQPCHHSAGGRNQHGQHKKSCCLLLKEWVKSFLKPSKIQLVVRCCNLYRIHWQNVDMFDNSKDAEIFKHRVQSARDGIVDLMKEGVLVCGMTQKDWLFLLLTITNRAVCGSVKIPFLYWKQRFLTDSKINSFLTSLAQEVTETRKP